MPDPELVALAKNIAIQHGLNESLVCAVVEQESSWEPSATRYEPLFRERYIVPLIVPLGLSLDEQTFRATSYGLMQVLGEVAREFGYTGDTEGLKDPATGLEFGCRKLSQCMQRAGNDAYRALEFFNGGGNKLYAGQVIARIDNYAT
jgi:soluble lytic murein transglycosylase-like protein